MAGDGNFQMNWKDPDKVGAMKIFMQKYELLFDAKGIENEKQVSHILLKDELKAEMDKMVKDKIIRKVDQPTEWVSSLTHSRKSSGQLCICLDPKYLNKAIKRCHHRTPRLEETT